MSISPEMGDNFIDPLQDLGLQFLRQTGSLVLNTEIVAPHVDNDNSKGGGDKPAPINKQPPTQAEIDNLDRRAAAHLDKYHNYKD